MTHSFFALGVIILAGCMAAIQAPMNAALGRGIGSSTGAATISFGVGFLVLLAYTVWNGKHVAIGRAASGNRWLLMGGVLGAFYVWAILWAVPTLGVVTAVSAMILGQLVVALTLDAIGPFGLPQHAVTPTRVLAVMMVAAGLALSKA